MKLPIKPITKNMIEQFNHEPTAKYFMAIYRQAKQSKYKNALEIGSWWGVSTTAILSAGSGKLTSIDKNICHLAKDEVNAYNCFSRWTFIHSDSKNILSKMGKEYDFIFVDGSHVYKEVKNDVTESYRILNKGGIMLIDDYGHPKNETGEYGVNKAVDELIKQEKIRYIKMPRNRMIKIKKI